MEKINDKEVQKIEAKASDVTVQAEAAIVTDKGSADAALDILKAIKELKGKVAETFDPIVSAAHEAHKKALAAKAKHLAPLEAADKLLRGKIVGWEAVERRRLVEEDRRKVAEAKALAEAEALAKAEELDALGFTEEAIDTLDRAHEGVIIERAAPAPSFAGASVRKYYSAEVDDLATLVRAVADGKLPIEYILPNMAALNSHVRAVKEAFDPKTFPGVRLVVSSGMSV